MIHTDYFAKYLALELTKRFPSNDIGKLASVLVDAQVELNPHQVEAALFAFRSPLGRGAILADEVGLGKTIEAGLVISQKWAERKRRILIITPANLRKQWHQEMLEKFFIPCQILETKNYNEEIKNGVHNPFLKDDIILICSYQFARSKSDVLSNVCWDLVTIDEAHRLRNVYKKSNIIANTLKKALAAVPNKMLLTATPLQNSLNELYGLVGFIDDQVFGDMKSFKEQYSNLKNEKTFENLRKRLKPVCHRTLRSQVTAFVPYTKRHPILQYFTPEQNEDQLYNSVSDYLQRDNLQALPASQRTLMTLVLRKLLASSSFAIAGALGTIVNRLKGKLDKNKIAEEIKNDLNMEFEALDEITDEWPEDAEENLLTEYEKEALEKEIKDLESLKSLAESIKNNSKGKALIVALEKAFEYAQSIGAPRKAIIFTESRQTQNYLLEILQNSSYSEGIVLFNGTNNDPQSKNIYEQWIEKNKSTDKITGSKSADMRSALVDYFRNHGQIMIATEAGAEGINLQFCSLVVNYDLPWNPQRIEQRIGRCHRYGQKYDVVVVNFLNQNNEADKRVFQLLSEKFRLFEGVFGASDEVLGAIESGVDFEKRIVDIYQRCRTTDEIQICFDQLQAELNEQINAAMTDTRKKLLENFDVEVHEKLRFNMEESRQYRNRYEQLLIDITRHVLGEYAEFKEDQAFILKNNPFRVEEKIECGLYELPRRTGNAHLYRIQHPLAQQVLKTIKEKELPPAELVFNYDRTQKIAAIEPYVGKSGLLQLSLFSIEALDQVEDHLIFSAVTSGGEIVEEDVARRMLSLKTEMQKEIGYLEQNILITKYLEEKQLEIQETVKKRNLEFFEVESEKLDNWAEDLKVALEQEIKEIDKEIKEIKRANVAVPLEQKLAGQKKIRDLERIRNHKRKSLFEAQDEIDGKRDEFIQNIEDKLLQKIKNQKILTIKWNLK